MLNNKYLIGYQVVLNWVNTYLAKLSQMRSWKLGRGGVDFSNKLCCLQVNTHEATLLFSSHPYKKLTLDLFKTVTYPKSSGLKSALSAAVKQHNLEGARCIWLLNPSHYQLILMEDLPVEPGEFQAAIRWKIKNLLSFPIEDAVIDSFPLPMQKTFKAQKMIMVIVSRASYLQPIVEQIQQSGLNLQVIDILELALRNIAASMDETGAALLYLKKNTGNLIITQKNTLYLARQIEFGIENMAEDGSNLEKLALEIQRSFDYFQSQWRIATPLSVFLASSKPLKINMPESLSNYLAIPVKNCDLTHVIENKTGLDIEHQNKYLPLIGALLRDEVHEYASTD
jgi:MSHA biogenesis protein MshI